MSTTLFTALAADWPLLGAPPNEAQTAQFAAYAALIVEWNQRINLTAIDEAEGIATRHFLDSLSVLGGVENDNEITTVIDVGSGAGFPGIPLAILRPTWQLTLLEATRKKVDFLNLALRELALDNVQTVWGRAEEMAQQPAHREHYDLAVARAVASLPVLAEFCLPFVRVGGYWVAQKGPKADEELGQSANALGQLGGKLRKVETITIPGLEEATRTLVVVDKVRVTPGTFPRRPGTPSKRPL